MRNRFNVMGSFMGEEEDEDQDSIKEAFLETNFYLLVLTFVVSIVHSVFEFLAFKNGKCFYMQRRIILTGKIFQLLKTNSHFTM